MADLLINVNQAISDFRNIKQAIINKGINVPEGTHTSKYSELINSISGDSNNYGNNFVGVITLSGDFAETIIGEITSLEE